MCAWSAQRSHAPSPTRDVHVRRAYADRIELSGRSGERTIVLVHNSGTIAGRSNGGVMEDFQEQEYEFLRRLEEERVDRRTLLEEGSCSRCRADRPLALAGRSRGPQEGARRPADARPLDQAHRDRQGGQEGRPPQHDRAAARLGELRRDHLDVLEEVRDPDHERQPGRQLGPGEPGRPLAQGRLRGLRTSSTSARRSRSPGRTRACTRSTTRRTSRRSRGR